MMETKHKSSCKLPWHACDCPKPELDPAEQALVDKAQQKLDEVKIVLDELKAYREARDGKS